MENNKYVAAYTTKMNKEAIDQSLHLAIGGLNGFIPLNYNLGVLYAKAKENTPGVQAHGTYGTRTLKSPWLFRMQDERIGVLAVETGDGSEGDILFWISEDLITYQFVGILPIAHKKVELPQCWFDRKKREYIITYSNAAGDRFTARTSDFITISQAYRDVTAPVEALYAKGIEGEISCIFPLTDGEAAKLQGKLGEFENIGVEEIVISVDKGEKLDFHQLPFLTAFYSDDSEAKIPVAWNESDYCMIDFNRSGSYKIRGKAIVKEYDFPLIEDRADPNIIYYMNKYYFIATNDFGQKDFYMRCSDTIEGLKYAEDVLILQATESGDMSGCNWAPELHIINHQLWMLFASGTKGTWDSVQCRMMRCNKDPMNREDWEKPIRVIKRDGEELCKTGITLDMTYFENKGEHYLVWAQREVAALSGRDYNDSSNLMIGKISPSMPWQLINEPVEICNPIYGWERTTTEVTEGPHIIKRKDKIFIIYSGSGVDETYALGLLTAHVDADLCDIKTWDKSRYPILASEHVEGQLGPGHNSFAKDEYGRDVIVYHAKSSIASRRHMSVRTIHWAADDTPILYLTGERELKREFRNVKASVNIIEKVEEPAAYLFAYFTGNEEAQEKLFYGVSRNGLDFRALNQGNPVHTSFLGTGCIRDPFIFKGEDGFYYILATDMKSSLGWTSNHAIIILKTKDFITIVNSTRIDYRKFNSTKKCNRAWAPQAIWCPEKKAYMIYLTIQNEDEDELGTVMWRHYAEDFMDFTTYTEPELMMKALEGIDGAIDGDIIYDRINSRYIMYYDGRRIAVSPSLSGAFNCIDPMTGREYEQIPFYTANGDAMLVEGSNIYQMIGKNKWIIAADGTSFNGGCYALAETTDFIHYRQLSEKEYSFDFTPRHGYVIPITESQLQKLFKGFGEIELP